jgi:hypothetical protein
VDFNVLVVSFAFGLVGMGMFLYGRKSSRPVPLAAGLALMTVPYFLPNLAALLVVCLALTAVPWLLRGA